MWSVLVIFILAIYPTEVESDATTNGTSGQPCLQKRCLSGLADCVNETCICRHPNQLKLRNGHFACYRINNIFGEVREDPFVTNFNEETANFPYPCRYLLTSTETTLRINKQRVGSCRCQLHSFNRKHRGKFHVGGFDFTCRINNTDLDQVLEFAISISGQAENGVYAYSEFGENQYLPNGPWNSPPVDVNGAGITVKTDYDPVNNQARVIIPECGWGITYVAYDIVLRRDQDQIPGLSFWLNCGLNPVFYSHDHVIATAPVRFGGTKYSDLAVSPLTVTDVLIIRALESAVSQNHPGGTELCPILSQIMTLCPQENRTKAVEECFWMFKEPRFIRCTDPAGNVDPLVEWAGTCIYYKCVGGVSCEDFAKIVSDKCGHVQGIPGLDRIVDRSFCNSTPI